MAKGIVLCYQDVDPGGTSNEFVTLGAVAYVGADVSSGALISFGPNGNGVAITQNVTQLAQYVTRVTDAVVAEGTRLGLTVARTDVLMPQYVRGS